MTVRIGKERLTLRNVNARAPQVLVLGSYLFTVGMDDIEEGCILPDLPFVNLPEEHVRYADFPASSTQNFVRTEIRSIPISPLAANGAVRNLGNFALLPRVANIPPWLHGSKDATWE